MTEVPVSVRIPRDAEAVVEQVMHEEHVDRSAALRKLLLIGADEYRHRRAIEALAAGRASFGEAADMAGLPLWEFRDLVKSKKVHWVADDVTRDIDMGRRR